MLNDMDAEDYREARELARDGGNPVPNERFAELHKTVRDTPVNKGKRIEKPRCHLCKCDDVLLLQWNERKPGFFLCINCKTKPKEPEVKIKDGRECPF